MVVVVCSNAGYIVHLAHDAWRASTPLVLVNVHVHERDETSDDESNVNNIVAWQQAAFMARTKCALSDNALSFISIRTACEARRAWIACVPLFSATPEPDVVLFPLRHPKILTLKKDCVVSERGMSRLERILRFGSLP